MLLMALVIETPSWRVVEVMEPPSNQREMEKIR